MTKFDDRVKKGIKDEKRSQSRRIREETPAVKNLKSAGGVRRFYFRGSTFWDRAPIGGGIFGGSIWARVMR